MDLGIWGFVGFSCWGLWALQHLVLGLGFAGFGLLQKLSTVGKQPLRTCTAKALRVSLRKGP